MESSWLLGKQIFGFKQLTHKLTFRHNVLKNEVLSLYSFWQCVSVLIFYYISSCLEKCYIQSDFLGMMPMLGKKCEHPVVSQRGRSCVSLSGGEGVWLPNISFLYPHPDLGPCVSQLGLNNKVPQSGFKDRCLFSQFWSLEVQDQGFGKFGFFQVFSPWLADGHLHTRSSHMSLHEHASLMSFCMSESPPLIRILVRLDQSPACGFLT